MLWASGHALWLALQDIGRAAAGGPARPHPSSRQSWKLPSFAAFTHPICGGSVPSLLECRSRRCRLVRRPISGGTLLSWHSLRSLQAAGAGVARGIKHACEL